MVLFSVQETVVTQVHLQLQQREYVAQT